MTDITSTTIPAWYHRALEATGEPGTVEVDGCRINFRVWGAPGAPGIVLVHGSNAHLAWWQFVAPFLGDQFRVAAFDLSGNGDSGWRDRYNGEAFARETWAVCDAAGLGERPFVVGHSFGGFVALETAYRFGERMGGVIFGDFTVSPPEDYTEWGGRAQTEPGAPKRRTRVYEDIETALGRFRLLPEQPCQHPYVMDYIARQSLRPVEGGWTWKFDPTLFDHLEMGREQQQKFLELTCRSALILGEHSEDDGAQSADHMVGLTGGHMPIFTIPGSYHHFMFDEPMAVVTAIKGIVLSWLREDHRDELGDAISASIRQYHGAD